MIYKISLKNQLKILSYHLGTILTFVITLFFLKFDELAIIVFAVFLSVISLIGFILHFTFLYYNYKQEIKISDDNLFVKDKYGNEIVYNFSELNQVIEYKSASNEKNGIKFTFIESYCYIKIISKSNETIIISCLMCPDLNEIVISLKGINYKRKHNPFSIFQIF